MMFALRGYLSNEMIGRLDGVVCLHRLSSGGVTLN